MRGHRKESTRRSQPGNDVGTSRPIEEGASRTTVKIATAFRQAVDSRSDGLLDRTSGVPNNIKHTSPPVVRRRRASRSTSVRSNSKRYNTHSPAAGSTYELNSEDENDVRRYEEELDELSLERSQTPRDTTTPNGEQDEREEDSEVIVRQSVTDTKTSTKSIPSPKASIKASQPNILLRFLYFILVLIHFLFVQAKRHKAIMAILILTLFIWRGGWLISRYTTLPIDNLQNKIFKLVRQHSAETVWKSTENEKAEVNQMFMDKVLNFMNKFERTAIITEEKIQKILNKQLAPMPSAKDYKVIEKTLSDLVANFQKEFREMDRRIQDSGSQTSRDYQRIEDQISEFQSYMRTVKDSVTSLQRNMDLHSKTLVEEGKRIDNIVKDSQNVYHDLAQTKNHMSGIIKTLQALEATDEKDRKIIANLENKYEAFRKEILQVSKLEDKFETFRKEILQALSETKEFVSDVSHQASMAHTIAESAASTASVAAASASSAAVEAADAATAATSARHVINFSGDKDAAIFEKSISAFEREFHIRNNLAKAEEGTLIVPDWTSQTLMLKRGWPILDSALGLKQSFAPSSPVDCISEKSPTSSCWVFKGHRGQIGFTLSQPILLYGITVEACRGGEKSENGDLMPTSRAWPKDMELWGIIDKADVILPEVGRLRTEQIRAQLEDRDKIHGRLNGADEDWSKREDHVFIGRFKFERDERQLVQTFLVVEKAKQLQIPVSGLKVVINNNHGQENYTGIRRVKIHGLLGGRLDREPKYMRWDYKEQIEESDVA